MKKALILSAIMMFSAMLSAQTQQGYVKTKGRMVNGKLVPGQGLKGATVSIKSRTAVLVDANDGAFSFPVPEKQFRLDSVRKKGYQLVDMDALGKTYKHSSNPLYLVMETPEQQLQDQLAAERKIRRTLTNQLHQREDEIEALKEQQKITDEEYRQALQKLYEDVDQNEQLVKDMVESYSKIDYDQLNDFDQKISELILNGELTKADSMLRTKGNINERVSQYKKHKAINAKEREELSQRQEQLEQSEILAQKELEDLANDCYRKFEIFKLQHLNDSAAYYIELRVGLDTTNIDWNLDAGMFIKEYLAEYDKALFYLIRVYNKSTDEIIKLEAKIAIEQIYSMEHLTIIGSYINRGLELFNQKKYDSALDYYEKAIMLLSSIPIQERNHPYIAFLYINIGNIYIVKGDNPQSIDYYNKGLYILEQWKPNHSDIKTIKNKIIEIESMLNCTDKEIDIQPIQLQLHQLQQQEDKIERLKKEIENYNKAINNKEYKVNPIFSL